MMGVVASRLSRWHSVFAAALQKRPAVGFHVALLEHLGRTPSHAEAVAARRAAHSFAAAGRGRLERVPSAEHGNRHRLVLVRTDTETTHDELVAALNPAGTSFVSLTAEAMHTEAARRLVDTIREASAQARHVETGEVSPTARAVLEAELGAVLSDLTKFRRRLARSPQPRSQPRRRKRT